MSTAKDIWLTRIYDDYICTLPADIVFKAKSTFQLQVITYIYNKFHDGAKMQCSKIVVLRNISILRTVTISIYHY